MLVTHAQRGGPLLLGSVLSFRALSGRASEFHRIRQHSIDHSEIMMLDDRYCAGLFDADGCVRISKNKSGHLLVYTSVANCHLPVLGMLRDRFGGCISGMGRKSEKHRKLYQWALSSAAAAEFLRAIGPFCVVKAEQVALALQLQLSIEAWRHRLGNQYRRHPERDAVMAYRAGIAEKIRTLKHQRFDL